MAVAVKNSLESKTSTAQRSLAFASVAGAIFILICAAVVFWGVPRLWDLGVGSHLPESLSFVNIAGLILVEVVAIGLLVALGAALVGPAPPRGLRAGIFAVLAWLFGTGLITVMFGRMFEGWFGSTSTIGMALTAAIGLGLLYWGFSLLSKPKTHENLRSFEAQGWFDSSRVKPMQGLRVRRATMLGVILLFGAGIYSLYNHGTLVTADSNWSVRLPFTSYVLPILPDIKFTVPLLLAAAGLWLAFRVVNLPVFADFLIATEAELNKVSWPTRKSVVQDTIVVLSTVFLLTIFLFTVDLAWGWILSREPVGVLRVQPQENDQNKKLPESTDSGWN